MDSEQVWDQSRKDVVAAQGGTWTDSATTDMLGMSSKEWPVYLIEQLAGVPLSVEEINEAVVGAMLREYRERLPLLPGAREAVSGWPDVHVRAGVLVATAGSSTSCCKRMGVADRFTATVSSEEVARGKPAPDVYHEALRQIGVRPAAGDRGLRRGPALRPRGRADVDRHPEPALPAERRRARARRRPADRTSTR